MMRPRMSERSEGIRDREPLRTPLHVDVGINRRFDVRTPQ